MNKPELHFQCACGQAITQAHVTRQTVYVDETPGPGEPPRETGFHVTYRCPRYRKTRPHFHRLAPS